jgi:hypothetical protein
MIAAAAAVAPGFAVHSWLNITCYSPHAMVAVNVSDVEKARRQGNYFPR